VRLYHIFYEILASLVLMQKANYMKDVNKKPLVVLEMANNHMGDVTHGKALISALTEIVEPFRS